MVSSSTERLAAEGEVSHDSPHKENNVKPVAAPRKRQPAAKDEAHVSQALRTVYQRAVEEDIPSEMLDLLSRLD